MSVLLEAQAPWDAQNLLVAAVWNRLDLLEVVLMHHQDWCPALPSQAACAGNVRFLMRIFQAGCPVWAIPIDGEPCIQQGRMVVNSFIRAGQDNVEPFDDWSLVVSSDIVLSGPVLVYAAKKGAPLTQRMQGMLRNVRSRALALAGCFHRAAGIRGVPGPIDRLWDAMGQVPIEIIQSIATLARISIVDERLIQ